MTTLKSLKMVNVIANSNLDASLISGLVRWHGGWSEFKDICEDLQNYGANNGNSFIWITDSVKFFKSHAKAIKVWALDTANDVYGESVIDMLYDWNWNKSGNGYVFTKDEIGQAFYTGKGDAAMNLYDTLVKAVVEELAGDVIRTLED